MARLTVLPADSVTSAELCALFNRCYADYFVPIQLTPEAFASMAVSYDLDLAASVVGLAQDAPAGCALLGVRGRHGWIGGMGVTPEARGGGHGRALMLAVLEAARARGLARVDLEVLVQNAPAIRIYETLGFRDRRLLDVWTRAPGAPPPRAEDAAVEPLGVAECLARHAVLHAAPAPWQRDLPSLERAAARLAALGVREGGAIAAYALYHAEGAKLHLLDLGAAPGLPGSRLDALLRALFLAHPGATASLVNLPADDPASGALARLGAVANLHQREMTLAF